ncbi:MAG: TonB-dependent receptor [Alphaproteobacteria bacterium]|mgnify:CR=1 FL=1|nr:TonB-dependent receptor [Alphaproteobacteria bacterium]
MKRILLATTAFGLTVSPGFAADPMPVSVEKIIVTGNRIGEVAEDKLGTAVTVISKQQLDERQTRYVSDVLRDAPGVAVNRTGGAGGSTQIRMRGSEGNHTLVLLDGAEISDPFQGEFDFSGLLATDIEHIEILRGSQSALYGSDAIGGVVNIIPRRGKGELTFEALAEAGSFATWLANGNASYGDDTFDVFASTSRHVTSGTNNSRFGNEDDGASDTSFFVNAGLRPATNIELRGFLRYVETDADGDPQDFDFFSPTQGFAIDGNETSDTKQLYGNIQAQIVGWNDAWNTKLSYAFADTERHNFSGGFPSFFTAGNRDKVSLVSALDFTTAAASHRLTGAVDWKRETYQNLPLGAPSPINDKRELETTGFVANYDLEMADFNAGAAIRHDQNENFQDASTYRLQASYRVEATRLRATAGSGVKNPTNFELFGFDPGSFIGNPNLKPEKSVGWDAGIDHRFWNNTAKLTLTYFQATLEDEIFTAFLPGFISTPRNRTSQSERQGIELTLDAAVEDWSLNAAYTYLDAQEAGQEEVRRPPHIASLNLTYRFLERGSATLSLRYNGEQQDNEFIFATPQDFVTLNAFTLVNLNASYRVTETLEVFGRVENLLDERYEEVFSFASPGLAAYAGVKGKF